MKTNREGHDCEIITPEEFMRRLHIKRTTFYNWKRSGKLVREKHYIQAGAVIRIFWSMQLLRDLDDPPPDPDPPPARKRPSNRKPRNGCKINLNY